MSAFPGQSPFITHVRGARVLIVGAPGDTLCDTIATAAESLGHVALCTTDPTRARELVESADLLLLDLDSVQDPLTLIAHLWCAQPELPVIGLASRAQRALRDGALRMGVMTVLPVPLEEAELRFALRLALEQSRSSAVQFTRELARTMSSLQALMGDALDIARLQPAVEEVARLFRADRASLLLFDDPSAPNAVLKMVAHVGFPNNVPAKISVRRGEGVAGRVAQEGIPQLLLRSLEQYDRFSDLSPNNNITASLQVPVRATGGERPVLGVLNLSRFTEGDVFTPRDLEVCEFIASSIGEMLTRLRQAEAQSDLQQRMAAVEKLSYAGELAAGIAHEVASPVSYVHANLKVLAEYFAELAPAIELLRAGASVEGEADPALKPSASLLEVIDDIPSLLDESIEGAERALHIVNEMKSMVRLGNGNEPRRPVALKNLVESTLRLLRPRLVGRCRVEMDLDSHATVVGREVELSQVLVNLIVNAADACDENPTRDGDALVSVRVAAEQGGCVLSVSDNGVGIPLEQQQRIFAPLFTTKPKGGTGLGLGIVRRIVDAHGGQIVLSSRPGVGTTFEIHLPHVDQAKAEPQTSSQVTLHA